MIRLSRGLVASAVAVGAWMLLAGTARGDGNAEASRGHPAEAAHVAIGVDAGLGGPFGDLGLRLAYVPHPFVSLEVGAGVGYVRAEVGALMRARWMWGDSGVSIGVGGVSGREYSFDDALALIPVTRIAGELAGHFHVRERSIVLVRLGIKVSPSEKMYNASSGGGPDYYNSLPQWVPIIGISWLWVR